MSDSEPTPLERGGENAEAGFNLEEVGRPVQPCDRQPEWEPDLSVEPPPAFEFVVNEEDPPAFEFVVGEEEAPQFEYEAETEESGKD